MFDRTRFQPGQDVYDVSGHKVGTVSNVTQNYLDVSAGFLGFEHLHVPFGEVTRIEGSSLYLNVPKDQIGNQGWAAQPANPAAPQGMYGTMPAATTEPAPVAGHPAPRFVGYNVYTSDRHDLGSVLDEGPNYVHLQTGFLGLGKDLYIPTDCIDHCDTANQRCYLSMSQSQISTMKNWNKRPEAGQQFTCGAAGTKPVAPIEAAPRAAYPPSGAEIERLPLTESDVVPDIERRQVGEVEITKRVEETPVSYNVPVSHDEILIREEPVNRPTQGEPTAEGEIHVPVYEERVTIERENRVYGEVDVEKRRVTEQRHIEGKVRREVPEVHKTGDINEDVRIEGNLEKPPDANEQKRKSA